MGLTFPLLSDMPRTTLEAYGFLETDPKNRLYRYAKRAYAIIDKSGTVRYRKVLSRRSTQQIANDSVRSRRTTMRRAATRSNRT